MQIDKRTVERLLKLDDQSLEKVIREVLTGSGLSTETLGLDAKRLEDVRNALQNASNADLELYQSLLNKYKSEKKNQGRRP